MKVIDLQPGMVFDMPLPIGSTAIFVQRAPHPLYRGLQLVIWRIISTEGWRWSHDALSAYQDVREPRQEDPDRWREHLIEAFHSAGLIEKQGGVGVE